MKTRYILNEPQASKAALPTSRLFQSIVIPHVLQIVTDICRSYSFLGYLSREIKRETVDRISVPYQNSLSLTAGSLEM